MVLCVKSYKKSYTCSSGLELRNIFWLRWASKIVYLANNRFSFVYFSSQRTLHTEKEGTFCRRFILYTFLVSGGLLKMLRFFYYLKNPLRIKKLFKFVGEGIVPHTYFQFYAADSLVLQPVKKVSHYVSFLRVLYITQVVGKGISQSCLIQ